MGNTFSALCESDQPSDQSDQALINKTHKTSRGMLPLPKNVNSTGLNTTNSFDPKISQVMTDKHSPVLKSDDKAGSTEPLGRTVSLDDTGYTGSFKGLLPKIKPLTDADKESSKTAEESGDGSGIGSTEEHGDESGDESPESTLEPLKVPKTGEISSIRCDECKTSGSRCLECILQQIVGFASYMPTNYVDARDELIDSVCGIMRECIKMMTEHSDVRIARERKAAMAEGFANATRESKNHIMILENRVTDLMTQKDRDRNHIKIEKLLGKMSNGEVEYVANMMGALTAMLMVQRPIHKSERALSEIATDFGRTLPDRKAELNDIVAATAVESPKLPGRKGEDARGGTGGRNPKKLVTTGDRLVGDGGRTGGSRGGRGGKPVTATESRRDVEEKVPKMTAPTPDAILSSGVFDSSTSLEVLRKTVVQGINGANPRFAGKYGVSTVEYIETQAKKEDLVEILRNVGIAEKK